MRMHESVLNDAINNEQKGCAVQKWTLSISQFLARLIKDRIPSPLTALIRLYRPVPLFSQLNSFKPFNIVRHGKCVIESDCFCTSSFKRWGYSLSKPVVQALTFNTQLTGYFVKYVLINLSSALHNVDMVPGGRGSLGRIFHFLLSFKLSYTTASYTHKKTQQMFASLLDNNLTQISTVSLCHVILDNFD